MSLEADRLNNLGTTYHKQGQISNALSLYNFALERQTDSPNAMANLSAVLLSAKAYRSALLVARRAVMLHPDNITARRNYAIALMFNGEFEESRIQHELIIDKDPESLPDRYDYALLLSHLNRHQEAIPAFTKVMELCQDDLELKQNVFQDRSISKLAVGDFPNALIEYVNSDKSSRVKADQVIGIPLWEGQELKGKRILVYGWAGFGDSIMCLRFLKPLEKLGAKITIAIQESLHRLVAREGYDVYNWWSSEPFSPQEYDYHCPLMRLPIGLGITPDKIDSSPFLYAKPSDDIGPDGFRVGICWGSGYHGGTTNWRRRYLPLELLLTHLWQIPKIRLVALQKEDPLRDVYRLGVDGLIHVPQLEDFAQTTDVIGGLDLVIAVDSAVAHIAGALGKPVVMIGLYTRCWRWWGVTDGNPWYRNFAIADQPRPGDWAGACERAAAAIRDVCRHSLWENVDKPL